MYDRRERAIRDRNWEINAAKQEMEAAKHEAKLEGRLEGELAGKIKAKTETIRMLQGLLYMPLSDENELSAKGLDQLDAMMGDLREKLRMRTPRNE